VLCVFEVLMFGNKSVLLLRSLSSVGVVMKKCIVKSGIGVTAFCALAMLNLASAAGPTFVVTVQSASDWAVDGQLDPTLQLVRGETYVFDLQNVSGVHPFFIKSVNSSGAGNAFSSGVTNNGATGNTDVIFTVPMNAPSRCFITAQRTALWLDS
jgi:hypothetical protein